MEWLLALTYIAFCILIFKVFKIPVNQWTPFHRRTGRNIRYRVATADNELQSSVYD
jgi:hypothetical protein